jgi:hypothetical protein
LPHQSGLITQKLGLAINGSQGSVSHQSSPKSNQNKAPSWYVCRGQQFAPMIALRFGIGALLLFGGTIVALKFLRDWRGWAGMGCALLGFLILMAPVPWDLGPCPISQPERHTDYRQPFQHNNEIVSQKSLDSI